ncbi:MAG: hypothetical protein ACYS9Y_06365 [Planctomycetota bacterium]|jgi:hypothetical protein
MEQQENCQGCYQKDQCQEVYRQLGNVEGPSVVCTVVVAFLVPIVVFIGVLAVFEGTFAGVISSKGVQTICGFLSAVAATYACVLITKVIKRRLRQR